MQNVKVKIYEELLPRIEALIISECDAVANLSNVSSVLHNAFGFWWTGFYIVKDAVSAGGENCSKGKELVLGPFQGPVACTRIAYGKGVCGTAWKLKQSIIVKDVREFSGHIACSSASLSEIAIPLIMFDGSIYGILDIDSDKLSTFDETDRKYLEKLAVIICKTLK